MRKIILLLVISVLFFANPVGAEENRDLEEEIIYDILVDRFNNGDPTLSEQVDLDDPLAYYGGDIRGIITKLDDLKELGFTAISLSSIMENAPKGYHGYWIEDFYEVEEQFGTMDDFNELVEEAHKRDINVILEFVTNYVSSSNTIAKDLEKEDWTKENKVEPTESTTWLEETVVLDQSNKEVKEFLFDVAEFWINETDIDGFKLHAAEQSSDQFLTELSSHIKDIDPDFYLLGGVLDPAGDIEKVIENANIDAVENHLLFEAMNDVFMEADNPVSNLHEVWEESENENHLIFIDNKNSTRFANNVADTGRNALTAWQLALTYMYAMPGTPLIYQGSELPMYGPGFPDNQELVQFNSPDPDLSEFHDRISAIRSEFPVMSYGDLEQVETDEGMSLFKRTYEDETIYIAINNDSESRSVSITGIDSDKQLRGLIGDNLVREGKDGNFRIGIPRETAEVYVIEKNTGFNFLLIGFAAVVFLTFVFFVIFQQRKQRKKAK